MAGLSLTDACARRWANMQWRGGRTRDLAIPSERATPHALASEQTTPKAVPSEQTAQEGGYQLWNSERFVSTTAVSS